MKLRREVPIGWLFVTPVLLWSTVFPLSKLMLEVVPPTTLAAIRFSIGGLVLLAYAVYAFSWKETLQSLRRSWRDFLLLGFIGIFMNNFLQNLGLSMTSASSAALLGTIDPVFTSILSALFLGEALTKTKMTGLMMAFAGVILVTTNGQWVSDWGESRGRLLVIGAAIGYSLYTILSKKILHKEQPPMVVAWGTAVGALFLILASVLVDGGRTIGPLTTTHIATLAYLSIVPTSIAVVVYFYLLQRIQASQASVTLFLIPVFAVLWSTMLLGERLTWAMLMGGALIILGVSLTMSRRKPLPSLKESQREKNDSSDKLENTDYPDAYQAQWQEQKPNDRIEKDKEQSKRP